MSRYGHFAKDLLRRGEYEKVQPSAASLIKRVRLDAPPESAPNESASIGAVQLAQQPLLPVAKEEKSSSVPPSTPIEGVGDGSNEREPVESVDEEPDVIDSAFDGNITPFSAQEEKETHVPIKSVQQSGRIRPRRPRGFEASRALHSVRIANIARGATIYGVVTGWHVVPGVNSEPHVLIKIMDESISSMSSSAEAKASSDDDGLPTAHPAPRPGSMQSYSAPRSHVEPLYVSIFDLSEHGLPLPKNKGDIIRIHCIWHSNADAKWHGNTENSAQQGSSTFSQLPWRNNKRRTVVDLWEGPIGLLPHFHRWRLGETEDELSLPTEWRTPYKTHCSLNYGAQSIYEPQEADYTRVAELRLFALRMFSQLELPDPRVNVHDMETYLRHYARISGCALPDLPMTEAPSFHSSSFSRPHISEQTSVSGPRALCPPNTAVIRAEESKDAPSVFRLATAVPLPEPGTARVSDLINKCTEVGSSTRGTFVNLIAKVVCSHPSNPSRVLAIWDGSLIPVTIAVPESTSSASSDSSNGPQQHKLRELDESIIQNSPRLWWIAQTERRIRFEYPYLRNNSTFVDAQTGSEINTPILGSVIPLNFHTRVDAVDPQKQEQREKTPRTFIVGEWYLFSNIAVNRSKDVVGTFVLLFTAKSSFKHLAVNDPGVSKSFVNYARKLEAAYARQLAELDPPTVEDTTQSSTPSPSSMSTHLPVQLPLHVFLKVCDVLSHFRARQLRQMTGMAVGGHNAGSHVLFKSPSPLEELKTLTPELDIPARLLSDICANANVNIFLDFLRDYETIEVATKLAYHKPALLTLKDANEFLRQEGIESEAVFGCEITLTSSMVKFLERITSGQIAVYSPRIATFTLNAADVESRQSDWLEAGAPPDSVNVEPLRAFISRVQSLDVVFSQSQACLDLFSAIVPRTRAILASFERDESFRSAVEAGSVVGKLAHRDQTFIWSQPAEDCTPAEISTSILCTLRWVSPASPAKLRRALAKWRKAPMKYDTLAEVCVQDFSGEKIVLSVGYHQLKDLCFQALRHERSTAEPIDESTLQDDEDICRGWKCLLDLINTTTSTNSSMNPWTCIVGVTTTARLLLEECDKNPDASPLTCKQASDHEESATQGFDLAVFSDVFQDEEQFLAQPARPIPWLSQPSRRKSPPLSQSLSSQSLQLTQPPVMSVGQTETPAQISSEAGEADSSTSEAWDEFLKLANNVDSAPNENNPSFDKSEVTRPILESPLETQKTAEAEAGHFLLTLGPVRQMSRSEDAQQSVTASQSAIERQNRVAFAFSAPIECSNGYARWVWRRTYYLTNTVLLEPLEPSSGAP